MKLNLPHTFLLTLFLLFFFQNIRAQKITAYDQLTAVNVEWQNQADVNSVLKNTTAVYLNEKELVRSHLRATEQLLRARNTAGLTALQKKNRVANLNVLHSYWQMGNFPVNNLYGNRQPIFIDENNNYCAVGYLMKQSGADAVAKDIQRTQNYSYLMDISHPKLMEWVANSGLAFNELCLIQPGYGGEWPATITAMHYNNTGTDVNEYIQVHQSNGELIGMKFYNTILFYDAAGTLYKTLQLSDMLATSTPGIQYYLFPPAENFADSGKIIIKSNTDTLSIFTYNYLGVRQDDYQLQTFNSGNMNFPVVRQFNTGEDNNTPLGSSLSFCGFYGSTWNTSIFANTPSAVNSCTVGSVGVSLIAFGDAVMNNKTVQLIWQTAAEPDNNYFEIERSSDGINFTSLSTIKATGTISSGNKYAYTDNKPGYINHYRLKQVGHSGKISYSQVLFVKLSTANPLVLLQNIVTDHLQLEVNLEASATSVIDVYDLSGRRTFHATGRPGSQLIDVSGFSAGKYLIRLQTTNGQVYSEQFVKQ